MKGLHLIRLFKWHVWWKKPSRLNRTFNAHVRLHEYKRLSESLGNEGQNSWWFQRLWSRCWQRKAQRDDTGAATWRQWHHCHGGGFWREFSLWHKPVVFYSPTEIILPTSLNCFFLLLFFLISSIWKRKRKDVLKMENTFPWANQTSKHICCWKTRKLGFHTKPKRCSSNSFYSLLPNLRSLNLSGDFKSILEAWQKILPISLPSKIHTLQVQSHTQHHRIENNKTPIKQLQQNKTNPKPTTKTSPPLCRDKQHLTCSDDVISILLEHRELRLLLFLHREQCWELKANS